MGRSNSDKRFCSRNTMHRNVHKYIHTKKETEMLKPTCRVFSLRVHVTATHMIQENCPRPGVLAPPWTPRPALERLRRRA